MNIFYSSIVMIIIYCMLLAISEIMLIDNGLFLEKVVATFMFCISIMFASFSRHYFISVFLGILITILVIVNHLKLVSKEQKEKKSYEVKKKTEIFNGKIIAHGYEQGTFFYPGEEKITVSIDGKTKTLCLREGFTYNSDKQIVGSNVKFNGLDEILEIY